MQSIGFVVFMDVIGSSAVYKTKGRAGLLATAFSVFSGVYSSGTLFMFQHTAKMGDFMAYLLLRLLCFSILLAVAVFIIKIKVKKLNRKKVSILMVCIILLCSVLTYVFPIERPFIRFDSPEKAYNYCYASSNLFKIIQNENIAVAIYNDNDANTFVMFEKDKRGWLINNGNSNNIKFIPLEEYLFIVCKSKNDGKILMVNNSFNDRNNYEVQITDRSGHKFSETQYFSDGINNRIYYTFLSDSTETYQTIINGKSINIDMK